jgi:hypothetical protein
MRALSPKMGDFYTKIDKKLCKLMTQNKNIFTVFVTSPENGGLFFPQKYHKMGEKGGINLKK